MMNKIRENALIESLAGLFPRSPLQRNALQESDAELLSVPGTDVLLAVTTDSVVEEIESGLYSDPYLIGWMTVIVNASDLAAVGAEPIGILLNETLPHDAERAFVAAVQDGIRDACSACGMCVVGGDTNFSAHMQMGACAVGFVSDGPPMTRVGCKPGDCVFASGRLGLGNAYAFVRLAGASGHPPTPVHYQPKPRLREGRALRRLASCCMDTSDAGLATLDQLMRLNSAGFVVERKPEEYLHADALRLAEKAGMPPWLMLAGPHGEFELIFTMAASRVQEMSARASAIGWEPVPIGRVVEEPGVRLLLEGKLTHMNTEGIRNVSLDMAGGVEGYVAQLLSVGRGEGR
jgi:thiamine-monophosphate kinase